MSSEIRVLHVDDDEAFRELTARYLEREGFDIVAVDGPDAALERLDDDIDCIVSDYDMPGTNGLEFLESVRERDTDFPFILFTGKGSEEIASEAISAGVTDYLQKRTGTDQYTLLSNRIQRAVTEQRTEEALEESERMLSTLVSNLPGIVYRCRNEPDWPMEYIGGNVAEITGYEPKAFLSGGKRWSEMFFESDIDGLWEAVQQAIDDREPFEVTYRIRDAEGDIRWVREQGQGVFESNDADDPVALEGFMTDVTDQKRRERELTEYDRLVDAMGDPVYTTDPDGIVTTFNDRAEAVTGYDAGEVLGEPLSNLLDTTDTERMEAVIRELRDADGTDTATYDITVRTADGETIELENHVALLVGDGEFHGTIGVLRDSKKRSETRLRRLHDATRELMAETDRDRIAELTTRAAREILELPMTTVRFEDGDNLRLAAATEETVENMGPRPPYPMEGTAAGRVYREGEPHVEPRIENMENPQSHGDAESAAYFPLGDHGVFIVASTEPDDFDETDIRLATILAANVEATLDRAEKEEQLRQERDDFAALFQNIPDPTVEMVIEEGTPFVKRVNPAFEEVFGYDAETLVGENLDDYILPDDIATEADGYNARIQDGESFHGEVRRLTADGIRDFILHVVPQDIGEHSTRGYAIYTDITDRKRRERELTRQNERLDRFANVVSHDLRNPLNVAEGRLNLARQTGDDEHFEAIEDAHHRMDELISGLLTLAQQGDLAGNPTELELKTISKTAWNTVETGGLTLEVDGAATLRADPERLRQLLENLFANVVEHADGATTVTIGTLEDGFYVEDDGSGIPEDERERIFESGYSKTNSTGFGLAIVETIADAHGWTVTATERAAGGARFEFRDVATKGR